MQNHKEKLSSRRQFLNTGLLAGGLSMFGLPLLSMSEEQTAIVPKAPHPLKILILGGTSFLGPHQIAYALGRGHSISIFTRGRTQPTVHKKLFKEVEQLVGDREDNLEALKGRKWDAVSEERREKMVSEPGSLMAREKDIMVAWKGRRN